MMGDIRFRRAYERVTDAATSLEGMRDLSDAEVIEALAGASESRDMVLVNVLASEALNRLHRKTAILESAMEGFFSITPTGEISYANPAALEMLAISAEELRGQAVHQVVAPRRSPAAGEHEGGEYHHPLLDALRQGKDPVSFEGTLFRPDGTEVPVEVRAAPILRDEERVGAVVSFIDITERQRLASELATQEERYRLEVEGVDDYAIFMMDPRGRILTWNRAAETVKGWREEEILGWHYSILFPPELVKEGAPWEELEEARTKGKSAKEAKRMRKDGTRFDASVLLTALRHENGDLRGFVKVTRDITERKDWERRLKASEQRYRSLFENHPDIVLVCDLEGRVLEVNAPARRALGLDPATLDGVTLASLVAPHARPRVGTALAACMAGGQETLAVPMRDSTGAWADLEVRMAPMRDEEGRVARVFAIGRPLREVRGPHAGKAP